jgi:hypothetical protein
MGAATVEQATVLSFVCAAWLTSLLPSAARRWDSAWLNLSVVLASVLGMGGYVRLRDLLGFFPSETTVRRVMKRRNYAHESSAVHWDSMAKSRGFFVTQLMTTRGISRAHAEAYVTSNPFCALAEDETVVVQQARFNRETGCVEGFVHEGQKYKAHAVNSYEQLAGYFDKNTGALLADQILVFTLTFLAAPDLAPYCVASIGTAKEAQRDPRKVDLVLRQWFFLARLATSAGLRVIGVAADGAQVGAFAKLDDPAHFAGPLFKKNLTVAGELLTLACPLVEVTPLVGFNDHLHLMVNMMARLSMDKEGQAKEVWLGNVRVSLFFLKAVSALPASQRLAAGIRSSDISAFDKQNFGRVYRLLQPSSLVLMESLATTLEAKATLLVLRWAFRGPLVCMDPKSTPAEKLQAIAESFYFISRWHSLNQEQGKNMKSSCLSVATVSSPSSLRHV